MVVFPRPPLNFFFSFLQSFRRAHTFGMKHDPALLQSVERVQHRSGVKRGDMLCPALDLIFRRVTLAAGEQETSACHE